MEDLHDWECRFTPRKLASLNKWSSRAGLSPMELQSCAGEVTDEVTAIAWGGRIRYLHLAFGGSSCWRYVVGLREGNKNVGAIVRGFHDGVATGVFSLVDSREAAEAPTASHGDGLESQCGGSHAAVGSITLSLGQKHIVLINDSFAPNEGGYESEEMSRRNGL
uniref:Uncharacterized protein n=1 Tax=Oryza glumipatula TaxID=40148 RepID=A0A0E0BRU6_9ORYZ